MSFEQYFAVKFDVDGREHLYVARLLPQHAMDINDRLAELEKAGRVKNMRIVCSYTNYRMLLKQIEEL
jgi:hypothetical protein